MPTLSPHSLLLHLPVTSGFYSCSPSGLVKWAQVSKAPLAFFYRSKFLKQRGEKYVSFFPPDIGLGKRETEPHVIACSKYVSPAGRFASTKPVHPTTALPSTQRSLRKRRLRRTEWWPTVTEFGSAQGRPQADPCLTATRSQTLSGNTRTAEASHRENHTAVRAHHAQQTMPGTPKGCVRLKCCTNVMPLSRYMCSLFAGGQWDCAYLRIAKDLEITRPWWSRVKIMTRPLLTGAQCHLRKVKPELCGNQTNTCHFLSIAELEVWHDSIHIS